MGTMNRREWIVLGTLALFLVGHIATRPDLFPFSTYPMFSDRTTSMSWLQVEGPDGPVSAHAFELNSDYVINPDAKYGLRSPGPNPAGQPADPADITRRVEERLPDTDLPWIVVTQTTVEAFDDGSISREETGSWRFDR